MSGGNSSNNGNGGRDGGGWGSKFLKVAGAAAATAAVAGGLYALLTSSATGNSEPEAPFGSARRVQNEANDHDPWSPRQHETPSQVGWTKPEFGWIKLNVDGSRVHQGPSAGCGGVLRDASGKWLLGFAQKLDPNFEAHETEIHGILKGLELAWEMNAEKLVVESDNYSVVHMVENGLGFKYNHPQFHIINRIRELRFDPKWQVTLVSVPRTANRVANRLAKDAHDLPSEDLSKYRFPPDNCTRLLLEDVQGAVSF